MHADNHLRLIQALPCLVCPDSCPSFPLTLTLHARGEMILPAQLTLDWAIVPRKEGFVCSVLASLSLWYDQTTREGIGMEQMEREMKA